MSPVINEPCKTPSGDGRIVYWRYAPPDYADVASVSVRLDSEPPRFIPYQGSIFPAAQVQVLRDGTWTPVRTERA